MDDQVRTDAEQPVQVPAALTGLTNPCYLSRREATIQTLTDSLTYIQSTIRLLPLVHEIDTNSIDLSPVALVYSKQNRSLYITSFQAIPQLLQGIMQYVPVDHNDGFGT